MGATVNLGHACTNCSIIKIMAMVNCSIKIESIALSNNETKLYRSKQFEFDAIQILSIFLTNSNYS